MPFFRYLLVSVFLFTPVIANEKSNLRFIDLEFIFQNSVVGKKISKRAISSRNSENEKNNKTEKKLEKQKNEILSKKNLLEKKEFDEMVISHQKEVQDYQLKKNKKIKDLTQENIKLTKNFMKKVDKVLLKYASDNKIDLILNKNTLIVSNSSLDITSDILKIVDKEITKID